MRTIWPRGGGSWIPKTGRRRGCGDSTERIGGLFRANPLRDNSGAIVKLWHQYRHRRPEAAEGAIRRANASCANDGNDSGDAVERDARRRSRLPAAFWRPGISAQDVTGAGWQKTIHPEDAARAAPIWGACIAAGTTYRVEVRTLRVTDHAYRWCVVTAFPLRDEHGQILKWHGSVIDVHDWKQTQEELRHSEQEARLIVDCIPAQVAVLGPTGEVRQINRRMAEFFGGSAAALQGNADGIPRDELPQVVAAMTKAFETGTPFELENHLRRFDGVYQWFQIRGTPLMDSDGHAIRWYFLIADMDERKRAEDALRRSQALLADAQRISATGSFSWRLDTDEITLSDELYRILELGAGSAVTLEQIGARVHPDDLPLLSQMIAQARDSAGTLAYELRLLMPDGRIKYTRTHGNVVHQPNAPRECVGAMQDVTQRHLSDQALDQARSELARVTRSITVGALTASIAHEVNQPLSGIITNAGTACGLTADPPNVNGALETARRTIRDGNRAADVIARLRALFTNRAVTPEVLDLNDAAQEVVSLVSNDLQRNRVVEDRAGWRSSSCCRGSRATSAGDLEPDAQRLTP
jgi:PAS domain S-box-containing protein